MEGIKIMSTSFPASKDNYTRPAATDNMDTSGVEADVVIDNIYDAIEAIQTMLGVTGSVDKNSISYKLGGIAGGDKAASLTGTETLVNKTLTSPTIVSPTITSPTITGFTTDSIVESTENVGVTVESSLHKDGDITLDNTKKLYIKDSGGTARNAITINSSDVLEIGSTSNTSFIQHARSGVHARVSAAQSIPSAVNTKVQFNNVVFDINNEYDETTNYRFTAAVEGYYMLYSQIRFDTTVTASVAAILVTKNGGTNFLEGRAKTLDSFVPISVSGVIQLDAGEYIEIYAYQSTGAAINIDNNTANNYLYVVKVF